MRATDFRIGNLTQDGEISMISNSNIWIGSDIFLTDEIEPIPLTEEWLLKFGFEKDEVLELYRNKNSGLTILICYDFICMLGYCHVKIKDVHQLQNLFYSLVGEEL